MPAPLLSSPVTSPSSQPPATLHVIQVTIQIVSLLSLGMTLFIIWREWRAQTTAFSLLSLALISGYVAIQLSMVILLEWLRRRYWKERQRTEDIWHHSVTLFLAQRDELERIVQRRTRQLQEAHLAQVTQLQSFVQVGKIAAELIHDLANPLATLSLDVENLEDNNHVQQQRVLDAINHMQAYIMTARRQLQHQETNTTFDVVAETQAVLKLLSTKAHHANVYLHLEAPPTVWLFGNHMAYHKIILNLVTNAIEAYGTGEPTFPTTTQKVEIVVRLIHHTVQISITDTAGGMPPEVRKQLFKPFFTTKSRKNNTGLGLSICRELVLGCGGDMIINSLAGQGTTFIVTFPLPHDSSQRISLQNAL